MQGDAAIYILRSAFGVNWNRDIRTIFTGDDLTDEDAMRALKGLAYNFRVVNSGLVQTMADHRCVETYFLCSIYFSYIFPQKYTIYLIDPRWPVFTLNDLLFRLPDTNAVQTMLLCLEQFMLNRRNK